MEEEFLLALMRRRAIENGVLRDVSDYAAARNFPYSVAVTAEVWRDFIELGLSVEDQLDMLLHMIEVMVGHRVQFDTINFLVNVLLTPETNIQLALKLDRFIEENGRPAYTVAIADKQEMLM